MLRDLTLDFGLYSTPYSTPYRSPYSTEQGADRFHASGVRAGARDGVDTLL